jgi:hypothetical protein
MLGVVTRMEIPPTTIEELTKHRDSAVARAQQDFDGMCALLAGCESVLQQNLLISLVLHTNAYYCAYHAPHVMTQGFGEPHWNGFTLRIFPEYWLTVASSATSAAKSDTARYRADILLLLYPPWNPQTDLPAKDILGSACTRLVAEVDGHDFHERTKEQAQRDKTRDRDLQAAGFTVFRFTGREVYSRVDDKALEIISYLSGQCIEYARRARLRFYEDTNGA